MITADQLDRAVADPVGLITDLVADAEKELDIETIRAAVTAVAGGHAKSRSLAKALAIRPAVLTDGRSPAPRVIGDLLIGLRKAGTSAIAPPTCAKCGKKPRTLQRKDQDWYCSVCGQERAECTACGNVRRIGFRDRLNGLADRNLTLATCRQADLERWMTSDDVRHRQEAGHFVRWALSQKIARDLTFPAERWTGPSQPMDDEARWHTARRLLHDDPLKPEDRLAGLLLLLYAQWPAAISRLTANHMEETDGAVHIRLGAAPVELPVPVVELALHQVEARRSHAVLGRADSPWLFPRGQPGRPISAWAMGERLRKLGIRLTEVRSTALFQLATELPAAVIARTLGIDITVAVKWQRAAAGDWGAYAAEISRRTTIKD